MLVDVAHAKGAYVYADVIQGVDAIFSVPGESFLAALDAPAVAQIPVQEPSTEAEIQAALTGHLVLSTLHTNDAPSTISRMLNMGIEPFLVASSLIGIQALANLGVAMGLAVGNVHRPAAKLRCGRPAEIHGYLPAGWEPQRYSGLQQRLGLLHP